MVTNKQMFEAMENVPQEQVDEIYALWFETCVPDQVKDAFSAENIVANDKMMTRMLIAQHGYGTAKKAIQALPLSKEHDGSRHTDRDGFPLVRRDLGTARRDAVELAGYWDHVK